MFNKKRVYEERINGLQEEIETMRSAARVIMRSFLSQNKTIDIYGMLYPVIVSKYDPDGRKIYAKAFEKFGVLPSTENLPPRTTYWALLHAVLFENVSNVEYFEQELKRAVVKDWLEENDLLFDSPVPF